jgi:hypothetical protein
MTDAAISPLRRRMIEDMTIRKFAPKTQHDYVQRIKNFTAFLGRSPDTASFEDVRRYQCHPSTRVLLPGTIESHNLVPRGERIQVVRPLLHHVATAGEELRSVVRATDLVPFIVRKLTFDPVGVEPHLV